MQLDRRGFLAAGLLVPLAPTPIAGGLRRAYERAVIGSSLEAAFAAMARDIQGIVDAVLGLGPALDGLVPEVASIEPGPDAPDRALSRYARRRAERWMRRATGPVTVGPVTLEPFESTEEDTDVR